MMEATDEDEASDIVSVRLDDGGVLLYETGNEVAWIESDVSIVLP